jgi:hypothetical protein
VVSYALLQKNKGAPLAQTDIEQIFQLTLTLPGKVPNNFDHFDATYNVLK